MQKDMIGRHQYPFSYVIETYGVPACIGREILHQGRGGVIAADRGNYIGVNFDDQKPGVIHNIHPTDGVVYLGIKPVRKQTRAQQRYQAYLAADVTETFAEWMGFNR